MDLTTKKRLVNSETNQKKIFKLKEKKRGGEVK